MKANGTCQTFSLILLISLVLGLAVRAESIEAQPKQEAIKIQSAPVRPAGMTEMVRTDIALDNLWVDATDCQIWVSWKNTGNQKIDKVLKDRVWVEDLAFNGHSLVHVVLEPGAYFSHVIDAIPGGKLQGTRKVIATIDYDNVLKESNENNNSLTKTLSCGQ